MKNLALILVLAALISCEKEESVTLKINEVQIIESSYWYVDKIYQNDYPIDVQAYNLDKSVYQFVDSLKIVREIYNVFEDNEVGVLIGTYTKDSIYIWNGAYEFLEFNPEIIKIEGFDNDYNTRVVELRTIEPSTGE